MPSTLASGSADPVRAPDASAGSVEAPFEHRLQALIEGLPAIVYLDRADAGPSTVYISPQVRDILGFTVEEWLTDDDLWRRHLHPDDAAAALASIATVNAVGRDVSEYRMIAADGRIVWVRDDKVLVPGEDGAPAAVHGVMHDITERVAIEERLRSAEKMEAIGRLAGGIAHDFNNHLTAIIGNAELSLEDLDPDDPTHDSLVEIRDAARRAAGLTRRLLTFGRRQADHAQLVDLGAITGGLEPMLSRLLGEVVELVIRIDEDLPSVRIDPSQFEQVLIDLAVNTLDAMPDGGVVEITIQAAPSEDGGAGEVVLIVKDSGEGMDAVTMERAFEPFFTTRRHRQRTGLGLATAFGIVSSGGGTITLESEAGVGTSVHIRLPGMDGAADVTPVVPDRTPAKGGLGTVLLVEDEDAVRSMISTVLERHGFDVLAAASGVAALAIAATPGQHLDLLISDVVMPGLHGREVAQRVERLHPGLPVLFMSGFPIEDGATAQHSGTFDFLQKPFAPDDLWRAVSGALARPRRTQTPGA
ncbi:MAG TPA: response regulator [Candidatus Saccharimonadales bacterium]|nr:response regulator [Candidatus Saccharimonadales bacterium]